MAYLQNQMNDECWWNKPQSDRSHSPTTSTSSPSFVPCHSSSLLLHNSQSAINRCLCTLWIRRPISIRFNSARYLDSTLFYLFQYETNENLLRSVGGRINEPHWVGAFFFFAAAGVVALTCTILRLVFMAGCHRGVWGTCVPIININKLSSLILIDIAN